jgi:hypothetical protein
VSIWILLILTTLLCIADRSTGGQPWTVWSNAFYVSVAIAAPFLRVADSDRLYYYRTLFPVYIFHIACASFTYHRTNTLWAQQWDTTSINLYAILELATSVHPVIIIASPASPFLPAPVFPAIVIAVVLAIELLPPRSETEIKWSRIACLYASTLFAIVAATLFLVPETGIEHGLWHVFSATGIMFFYISRIL